MTQDNTRGGIEMNAAWIDAEAHLSTQVDSRTIKLTINGHDVYAKIGFAVERPVYVDITLSHNSDAERSYATEEANELATRLVDNARAQLEITCKAASALLQADVWSLDDLIEAWRGTKFEPAGVCNQIEAIASSPLDAAARYFQAHADRWPVRHAA